MIVTRVFHSMLGGYFLGALFDESFLNKPARLTAGRSVLIK